MIDTIRRVFSKSSISCKDGWVFVNYTGKRWITQEVPDKSELIGIFEKSSGFSIKLGKENVCIGFSIPEFNPAVNLYPPSAPRDEPRVFDTGTSYGFYDYMVDNSLLDATTEEKCKAFLDWAFPETNILDFTAEARLRKMRGFLTAIIENGFFCDFEIGEVFRDCGGCITLYIDRDAKLPPLINGKLKRAFEGLIAASGGFYFDVNPPKGYLTLQFVT